MVHDGGMEPRATAVTKAPRAIDASRSKSGDPGSSTSTEPSEKEIARALVRLPTADEVAPRPDGGADEDGQAKKALHASSASFGFLVARRRFGFSSSIPWRHVRRS